MDQWLKHLQNFYQWTDRVEVNNGGVLVLAVLLAFFALGFLALVLAVAEDEKQWKEEKKELMGLLQDRRPAGVYVQAKTVNRKENKAMSTVAETKQMVKEIGLLRTLAIVTLAALLGKMLKSGWEQIKHHFEGQAAPTE